VSSIVQRKRAALCPTIVVKWARWRDVLLLNVPILCAAGEEMYPLNSVDCILQFSKRFLRDFSKFSVIYIAHELLKG